MPSSRHTRLRSRAGAGIAVLLALNLGACAGDFAGRTESAVSPESAPATETVRVREAPVPRVPLPDAMPPDNDLWRRIDRGFELSDESDRNAVRRWVQFYSSRPELLAKVAENARPFLWHVVEEIEARDMPMELALLPFVESGYNPTAYSYAHASGMWQFMPYTARRFGLREDWWYDGRRDALRSTDAALDYLAWLYNRYGDWLLALAAYNAGEGRVDRALAESPQADYWGLDLPRETENYVPKLLALKELLVEAPCFAFDWPRLPNEPLTELVTLPGQVELSIAADMMHMPASDLRKINPGVRRWATHPEGPHSLLVPSDRADELRAALAERSPEALVTWHRHHVRRGEVLSGIARRYGTNVAAIQKVNNLNGTLIRTGQYLLIPIGGEVSAPPADAVTRYTVVRGDSLWRIARRFDVSVAQLRAWNGLASGSVLRPGQPLAVHGRETTDGYYRVRAGDSLWSIATRFSIAVEDLKSWNDIVDTTIRPGQRLLVRPGRS